MPDAAMQPKCPSDPALALVDVPGHRVASSLEGTAGPTVVCIPGLPGGSRDYRWLAPALSPWARVLRLDPPGFGASPRRGCGPMTVGEKASAVAAVMAHADAGPAILIGHSFGSVVAAEVAARQPDRVSHLVLLAPPGVQSQYPARLRRLASAPLRHGAGRRLLAAPVRSVFGAAGFSSSITDAERAYAVLDSGVVDFAAYRRALASYPGPVLIAWADDDRQVPARNSRALADIAAPGPRVGFITGGHNIQKSRAVPLAGMIRSFAQA